MANPNPVPPPIHGQWKPGQSGNPKGRPPVKPYREALQRMLEAAAVQKAIPAEQAHDLIAAAHIARCMNGDMSAIKEFADRIDGKVPNTIGGSTEVGPIRLYWPDADE